MSTPGLPSLAKNNFPSKQTRKFATRTNYYYLFYYYSASSGGLPEPEYYSDLPTLKKPLQSDDYFHSSNSSLASS